MKDSKERVKAISRRDFMGKAAALSGFFIVPRAVLGNGYIAPSDRINLGFIGAGRQAGSLQKSFLETGEAQIIAACDAYTTNLDHFTNKVNSFYGAVAGKESYRGCDSYSDFREILALKDIDAVVIATPDHWHAVQAILAAEAGKDIYCEKPLSLAIEEGRAMVDATRKHNRVFQTGSMQRSWKEFRHAVELIRNGYIGEIKSVQVNVGGSPAPYSLPGEAIPEGLDWDLWLGPNFYAQYNHELVPAPGANFWGRWRYYKEFGGGDMTDWGAHMFDIVQWALDMDDSGPVEIIPPDGKEYPVLTYRYDNGIPVTHENFGWNHAIRFTGSTGRIDIKRHKLETTPASLKSRVIGQNEKKVYRSDNHYKDWLSAIRTRKKPICDVEIGHRSATVCTLGNIAYELKERLKWDPKKEKFTNERKANDLLSRKMREKWSVSLG